jgi:valyl-tRNA synthetase
LDAQGLLEKVEDIQHAVGHCQRCTQVVEPLVSKQWFVDIQPLAKPALEVVRNGKVRILPERFSRIYENWMENLRDWCISRQLWWGHRIPVWYCSACDETVVELEDPTTCSACGSTDLRQDEDMLDTWFSSGLWPHSTLGWPDETESLKYFYPTSVMETAHDILFFWVARMIMLGIENMGEAPFHTVYLSGLIRDVEGAKMSKTKGNVLDPLEAIDTYGCDALRFALTAGNAPGNDSRLGPAKLEAARNFANKMWNASRYVMRTMEAAPDLAGWSNPDAQHLEDRWINSRLNRLVARVTRQLEEYQLGDAEQSIYEFLWDEYCDWYIEAAKVRLRQGTGPSPVPMLVHVLETTLRLLHPFMPFVTEEIWTNLVSRLPKEIAIEDSIMISPYPESDPSALDDEAEESIASVRETIRLIRNARAEFHITSNVSLELLIAPGALASVLETETPLIKALAKVEPLRFLENSSELPTSGAVTAVVSGAVIAIPMEGLVDLTVERKRLSSELEESEEAIGRLNTRLLDPQFMGKAPEEIVERERERLRGYEERRDHLQELLTQLSG